MDMFVINLKVAYNVIIRKNMLFYSIEGFVDTTWNMPISQSTFLCRIDNLKLVHHKSLTVSIYVGVYCWYFIQNQN